jgi:hypothetical protein
VKRVVLIAAVMALALPGSAAAQTLEDTVAQSQPIAVAYWAQHGTAEPICSPVTLRFDVTSDGDIGAGTVPADCRIDFAPVVRTWTPAYVCATVIHEYGHLGYMWHTDDPNSIMYGGFPLPIPAECAVAFPAAAVQASSATRIIHFTAKHRRRHRHR